MSRIQQAVTAIAHLRRTMGRSNRVRKRVARRHLRGSGIEIGALHLPVPTDASVSYVDRLARSELRRQYPELAALPLVEPDIIDDGERLETVPDGSQDFIIANHFIEHCQDPIGALKTFAQRLRPGGRIYMAVPDKRHTFDRNRPSTSNEHLAADHADGGFASRVSHYEEFARLASLDGKGDDATVRALTAELLEQDYSIHFHVWDPDEFAAFVQHVHEVHAPEISLIESVRNQDETIFVLARA